MCSLSLRIIVKYVVRPRALYTTKIDYCNSRPHNLPATQTNRLQLVLNSAARDVTKTPNFITLLLF